MEPPDELESPWDLLEASHSPLHPRFRRLGTNSEPPGGLPYGFTLGPPLAPGNDWSIFAEEANARGPVDATHRVLILYEPSSEADAEDFAASLTAQVFAGSVALSLHGPAATHRPDSCPGIAVTLDGRHVWDPATQPDIGRSLATADTVLYLSGRCVLDPLALERICRMTRISPLIVAPLAEAGARPDKPVIVPATPRDWPAAEPYRHVRGLNLALPASLAQTLGPLSPTVPGSNLALRCYERGAYFAPVFVPVLSASGAALEEAVAERSPRTSVIVVSRGDVLGAGRTIESLRAQRGVDVEILLLAVGMTAALWSVLERRYRNTGIGVRLVRARSVSAAIEVATGHYVGILVSGDTLTPDAIESMVQRLHLDPNVAVVQIREIENDASHDGSPTWKRTGERRLSTAAFPIFRKSTWARGTVDERGHDTLGLLLALSGLGHVETARTGQLRRGRLRLPSASLEDPRTGPGYVQPEAARRSLTRYWRFDRSARGTAVARAREGSRLVVFWPDYSRDNAYQRLLYGTAEDGAEYVAGDIDAAIRAAQSLGGNRVAFHMHWTNRIFRLSEEESVVRAEAAAFLVKVETFRGLGGLVIWTVHNIATHDTRYFADEIDFARQMVDLAHRVHIHAARSLPEIEAHFAIPREKLRVARHGHYMRVYADFVPRVLARRQLGLADDDDVLLFTGSLRSYKGPQELVAVFRRLLPANPRLFLILAGDSKGTGGPGLLEGLTESEQRRVLLVDRFLDDDELQVYFRAADAGVYPYDEVLTSGSVLLALGFGLPIVAPRFGMIEEALDAAPAAGVLYARNDPLGLEQAIFAVQQAKRSGRLEAMRFAALDAARRNTWQPFVQTVLDP